MKRSDIRQRSGLKTSFEIMKKVYITPQTEALELLGANAIMASSPGFILGPGDGTPGLPD